MRTLPFALALLVTPLAHADIFKCVDGEGRITYTNSPATSKGCTPLKTDQAVSSIPAPARPAQATPGTAPAGQPSTSGSFPRVAPEAQRARDDTRRQILERELANEEQALASARQALTDEEQRDAPEDRNVRRTGPDGRSYSSINPAKTEERLKPFRDRVELHQRNLEALRREINGLR